MSNAERLARVFMSHFKAEHARAAACLKDIAETLLRDDGVPLTDREVETVERYIRYLQRED